VGRGEVSFLRMAIHSFFSLSVSALKECTVRSAVCVCVRVSCVCERLGGQTHDAGARGAYRAG
jgi:hypothetical protein